MQKQGQGRFREKEPFHSANPEFCSNNYVPALFDPRLLARYRSFYRDLLAEKIFGESTSRNGKRRPVTKMEFFIILEKIFSGLCLRRDL